MRPREFLGIVAVVELLREAVAAHADVLIHAVVCGDLLPEAALERAVLEGEDEAVLRFQPVKQLCIEPREEDGVDDRRVHAVLCELGGSVARHLCEVAGTDDGDLRALRDDLIAVECAVVCAHGVGRRLIAHDWHVDHDGMRRLRERPAQHREILLEACGREKDEVRDVCKERDVEEAEMRHIVHPVECRVRREEDGGIVVHRDILRHLIVDALEERAVCAENGTCAAACEPRCHRDGLLLCDAHIDVLRAERCAVGGREPDAAHRARREEDKVRVPLCLCLDEVHRRREEGIGVRLLQRARFDVKRHTVVPRLRVFLGKFVALALLRMDVDDDGRLAVLYRAERSDQRLAVVAVGDVAVVEAHRAKEVILRRAVRLAQAAKLLIHTAVVLGDGLVVVVKDDDEVRLHLARDVQPLECLAARHRAVADEGDDVLVASCEVARLGETRRETDRGGCVPDIEEIVRALLGIRIARDLIVLLFHEIRLDASRQHLVRVGLMRHVVDDLVRR